MMNQEIRHSMQENERQQEMRQWQITNVTTEVENRKQWTKLKETSTKIQDRLRIISFAMQAIPAGIAISRDATRIKQTQERIIEEIRTAPYSLVVALPMQVQFVDDMQMVIRLLTGIVVSYGAINQMEKQREKYYWIMHWGSGKFRPLVYIYAHESKGYQRKVQWQNILFKYYANRDKQIVKDIMTGIKTF